MTTTAKEPLKGTLGTLTPDNVDCRNDPQAPRGLLLEISRQASRAGMKALYEKYRVGGGGQARCRRSRIRSDR